MADTDSLRAYKPQDYPTLPGSQERFIPNELQRLSNSITQLIEVMKKLEARMAAAGI